MHLQHSQLVLHQLQLVCRCIGAHGVFRFHGAAVCRSISDFGKLLLKIAQILQQRSYGRNAFLAEVLAKRRSLLGCRQLLYCAQKVDYRALGIRLHAVCHVGCCEAQLLQNGGLL